MALQARPRAGVLVLGNRGREGEGTFASEKFAYIRLA